MEFSIVDLISLLLFFLLPLLAFFFFTTSSENPLSNSLMGVFLVINAIDSGPFFILDWLYRSFPGWSLLLSSTVLFKAPVIYLYFKSVMYTDFKLNRDSILHVLPFLFVTVLFLPRFYMVDQEEKLNFLYSWFEGFNETKISYLIIHLQVLGYLIASYLLIRNYRKVLLENYSDRDQFNYAWLYSFLILYTVNFLMSSVKNLFLFLDAIDLYQYLISVAQSLFLGFICWIFWKALKSPMLFRGVSTTLRISSDLKKVSDHKADYDPLIDSNLKKLKEYMIQHQPYLDASLTLESLADQLNMVTRDLSPLINQHAGQHFFDFINSYRINKAKEMIENPADEKMTILEILYQVGFNSKSSFNTAFKKHAGMTPTQFKDSVNRAI